MRADIGLKDARVELRSLEGEQGTKRCRPMFGVNWERGTAANHMASDDGPFRCPPLSGCSASRFAKAQSVMDHLAML